MEGSDLIGNGSRKIEIKGSGKIKIKGSDIIKFGSM